MKSMKFELIGFSCLIVLGAMVLVNPNADESRKSLKDAGRAAFSKDVFRSE